MTFYIKGGPGSGRRKKIGGAVSNAYSELSMSQEKFPKTAEGKRKMADAFQKLRSAISSDKQKIRRIEYKDSRGNSMTASKFGDINFDDAFNLRGRMKKISSTGEEYSLIQDEYIDL